MTKPAVVIRSPKQGSHVGGAWYPYYAGYTVEFVTDALTQLVGAKGGKTVIDPWNGSGTTTTVALSAGHTATGFDSNPALILIARARNLAGSSQSLKPLAKEILKAASRSRLSRLDDDPMGQWFKHPAAIEVRKLQNAIDAVLVARDAEELELDRYSDLAAFYYTAAFEALRGILNAYRSSNPTWLRVPDDGRTKLMPSGSTLHALFLDAVSTLASRLTKQTDDLDDAATRHEGATIQLGDSRALKLEANSMSACLTSPPYCTRIDYVVSTRAELAFMGIDNEKLRSLREGCIGSPTISKEERASIGNRDARQLISSVTKHDSWAAASYYAPYLSNYFADLEKSLGELDRVVKSRGGRIGLVVQDSYFKDVHIDLQELVVSMMDDCGRSLTERYNFSIGASRGDMNPRARVYAKAKRPDESLLIFK